MATSDAELADIPITKPKRFSLSRLFASPRFQSWASDTPLLRRFARREGEEIFDLVMGFVNSQVLWALVELRLLHRLLDRPLSAQELSNDVGLPQERMFILLQAGVALGLLRRKRGQRFGLSRKGASLLGVPGLVDMITHHRHFYRDLSDPVALLRDDVDTELSRFWPYVFGASHDAPPDVSHTYSHLMEASQRLVAHDTLKMIPMGQVQRLLDVGGGTGAFLRAVVGQHKTLSATIFDLPQVEPAAEQSLAELGLTDRISFYPGSFRDDPLPKGFDAISLIRVLYDHSDETVLHLLDKVYNALPDGGHLFISEPMSGGADPSRAGDVYFAFYTMAMRTGKARSPSAIKDMCKKVGFQSIKIPKAPRPFVTSSLICIK